MALRHAGPFVTRYRTDVCDFIAIDQAFEPDLLLCTILSGPIAAIR
jgi:hypothetical protein